MRQLHALRTSLSVVCLLLVVAATPLFAKSETWADSPEANFLTSAERQEWAALKTDAEREQFKQKYWLKRDPTPGTATNEFRDVIRQRVHAADQRFGFQGTIGSHSARGMVFIVFGAPAHTRDKRGNETARGDSGGTVLEHEGLEYGVVWNYDRERTPKILAAIDRPSFDVEFIVDPNRRRDALQSPGLVNRYRELIAEKSIVNPNFDPAALAAAGAAEGAPAEGALSAATPSNPNAASSTPSLGMAPLPQAKPRLGADFDETPGKPLGTAAAAVLDATGPPSLQARFGKATLGKGDEATTVLWMFLPGVDDTRSDLNFYGVVKNKAGEDVAHISRPMRSGSGFTTGGPGAIAVSKLRLPPGSYRGVFAVAGPDGKAMSRGESTFSVPKSDEASVSQLMVASNVSPLRNGARADLVVGGSAVEVRADSTFRKAESLWYLVELANPTDPLAVTMEHRIRSGPNEVGAPVRYKATLQDLGSGVYVTGFEIPLSNLSPGDYNLYVTVQDGSREELRRADFKVVEQ